MKKVSTAGSKGTKNFPEEKLTIGLDLGGSVKLVLRPGRSRRGAAGRKSEHNSESDETGVRKNAAEPDRIRDRDAFTLGEPVVERVGARSDRGACAPRAFDRRESSEGRSTGCENLGPAGKNRPATAGPGEAS